LCVPCGLAPGPWIAVSLPSVGGSPGRKYFRATITLLFVNFLSPFGNPFGAV
jgi:hypothetical protein